MTDPYTKLLADRDRLQTELATFTATREHVNGFAPTPEGEARRLRYHTVQRQLTKLVQYVGIVEEWMDGDASMDDALYVLTDHWRTDPDEAERVLAAADPDLYMQQHQAACERRSF